jgi:tripartite-type tricarboxylate transporter receptor subunit TctC
MTGVELTNVPYRGVPPALTDFIAGRVQVMFDNLLTSLEHIKSGKLRPLAMATATRFEMLPDIPTVAETVPGYEASSIFGVGVRTGTSAEIVEALNREINAALADPVIRRRLIELSSVPIPGTPKEFAAEMAATTQKWGNLIKQYGIKPQE